jgi:type II secretory pathway pseudopilin PulG
MSNPVTTRPLPGQRGFSFLEVIIAMSVLIVGSVSVIGLFALGVNRMVERRIEARTAQMRPEIDSILQAAFDETGGARLPEEITREKPRALSRRGYALAVKWHGNPHGSNLPGVMAHAELLYQGQPVNVLIIPLRISYLDPSVLKDEGPNNDKR